MTHDQITVLWITAPWLAWGIAALIRNRIEHNHLLRRVAAQKARHDNHTESWIKKHPDLYIVDNEYSGTVIETTSELWDFENEA